MYALEITGVLSVVLSFSGVSGMFWVTFETDDVDGFDQDNSWEECCLKCYK